MAEQKIRLMTRDKGFYQSLMRLAIPGALQALITFTVGFADNLMVGALGDIAVSGVYMGNQFQTFLQLFIAGIEGALLVLGAQYWGKKDVNRVRSLSSIALHFGLGSGLIIMLLCLLIPKPIISLFTNDPQVIEAGAGYLRIVCISYGFFAMTQVLIATMRAVEVAKIGMYVSLISLFTNVTLNYVLIFGKLGLPALGITGAAIATLLARMIECLVMWIYILKIDKKLQMKFVEYLRFNEVELRKDFVRYGLPLVGGQIVWSVNMMANSAIVGRFPSSVITGVSVANTLNSLAYVGFQGVVGAVSIIIGKTVGSGQVEKVKEYSYTTQFLCLGMGILTGLMVLLLRKPFIGLYSGITPEAASYALQFCLVLSVTIVGTCYQAACLAGLVKAGGDVDFVFKNDTIFVFLVVLPSAIIAAWLGAAPWIVFACLKCDQILKCFVAVVKINSFNWIRDLTK